MALAARSFGAQGSSTGIVSNFTPTLTSAPCFRGNSRTNLKGSTLYLVKVNVTPSGLFGCRTGHLLV